MEPVVNQEMSSKEKLHVMEAEGKYLFHGSYHRIEKLEPRQAYNYLADTLEAIPDGEPAVFASDLADAATFMAVLNRQNLRNSTRGLRSGMFVVPGGIEYAATSWTIDKLAEDARGYVHVLDRKGFKLKNTDLHEWICTEPVEPIEIIEVTNIDLPENIVIKEF